jgi:hypothetical protein
MNRDVIPSEVTIEPSLSARAVDGTEVNRRHFGAEFRPKPNDYGFAISEKPVLRYDLAAGVILRIAHKD